jgi:hypothetical protein
MGLAIELGTALSSKRSIFFCHTRTHTLLRYNERVQKVLINSAIQTSH